MESCSDIADHDTEDLISEEMEIILGSQHANYLKNAMAVLPSSVRSLLSESCKSVASLENFLLDTIKEDGLHYFFILKNTFHFSQIFFFHL